MTWCLLPKAAMTSVKRRWLSGLSPELLQHPGGPFPTILVSSSTSRRFITVSEILKGCLSCCACEELSGRAIQPLSSCHEAVAPHTRSLILPVSLKLGSSPRGLGASGSLQHLRCSQLCSPLNISQMMLLGSAGDPLGP